ncbi:polysaccharide deacetylase family protein [Nostoc sp. LEGE 06077]|uniref:polysaccharide deacetylase family protein n=1 Tax=Nostoc sp. LEGE 06077 TaxID=915325 RepID=UPI00187E520F|nr:polysaccharide deacetylase family protein [Nostoc sp. LEGE 06077]MBE9205502.1 polysaccharide deacetylase family protein [Nostoc sp. LEGE 06077]
MTNKILKQYRIFGFVAISYFVTACSTFPQLTIHQPISKVLATKVLDNWVQSQIEVQLPLSTQIEQESLTIPAKFQGKTLYKVEPGNKDKVIALTVDDGPWPKTTLQMLDIFKANNVKVTFFWVGSALQANTEIAKQVVAEGHAIGNHTWHHWYKQMDEATAKKEIDRTSDLIYKTTGVKTTLFRPPGGFLNNGLAAYAKSQKYSVVMWSLTSADTDPHAKPQAFVNNVLKGAKPGAIVLMHDGGGDRHRTVEALPQIITGLKQQGYRFVTIPELLQESGK